MSSVATLERRDVTVADQLKDRMAEICAGLPSHIDPQRFERAVMTALNRDPGLMSADRRSLFVACQQAAQDGLLPDGKQGVITVRNVNVAPKGAPKDFRKTAVWMPMVYGIRKRLAEVGVVKTIRAKVVYENDQFEIEEGDEPRYIHKPALKDRGAPLGVYAIAELPDGTRERDWMPLEDVKAIQAKAMSQYGPWADFWGEMARKSAVRRLAKTLPIPDELGGLLARDNALHDLTPVQRERQTGGLAAALEHVAEDAPEAAVEGAAPIDHDAETGEVFEADAIREGFVLATDWRKWGKEFADAVKATESGPELDDLINVNMDMLQGMEEAAPKMSARMDEVIAAKRQELEGAE